jgi:hypothetical protein
MASECGLQVRDGPLAPWQWVVAVLTAVTTTTAIDVRERLHGAWASPVLGATI